MKMRKKMKKKKRNETLEELLEENRFRKKFINILDFNLFLLREICSSMKVIKTLEKLKEKLENYSIVKTATETLMMEKDLAKTKKIND
jgi:hypothetical protein